jgi:hypothetical protein
MSFEETAMTPAGKEPVPHPVEQLKTGAPDWAVLYPADPELMTSVEGDTSGLAQVKRAARARIARSRDA